MGWEDHITRKQKIMLRRWMFDRIDSRSCRMSGLVISGVEIFDLAKRELVYFSVMNSRR
jgi:hypothetical protein